MIVIVSEQPVYSSLDFNSKLKPLLLIDSIVMLMPI